MKNFDSYILTSGVIAIILISATVITYTTKFIFLSEKLKKTTNQIYDPDHGLNISYICILSKNAYVTLFDRSPCVNKTLVQWYNPWVRHILWIGFWNEIEAKNRLRLKASQQTTADDTTENITRNEAIPPTVQPQNEKTVRTEKKEQKPNEFVYSLLVGLLLVSGVVACWELFKDKLKRSEAAAAKAQELQCTLADFTINRHIRRETQQQATSHLPRQGSLELTAKVTQNLIHQSSLDRDFPKTISEVTTRESRRNSMPSYFANDMPPGYAVGASSSSTFRSAKRQSVDLVGKEINWDLKKKPRHFIRRH